MPPHTPKTPWEALECGGELSRVSATWQRWLGELHPAFAAAFLQRTEVSARFYPCPLQCGCMHEVIHYDPGDIAAVCRCDPPRCEDLALAQEDLACWEISWSKLGRALCHAFGLSRRPATLGPGNTRQIGSWSAAAVPLLLTLESEPHLFQGAINELAARLRGPFVLLAPTARNLTVPCLEALARAKAGFFDLASNALFTPEGMIRALQPPGELFAEFTPQPRQEDQGVLQRAFALVKALDQENRGRPPTALAVFSLYCLDGLNVSQLARKARCSRGTILNRLRWIRRRTGLEPDRLRSLSGQFEELEDKMTDPRARRIYRRQMIQEDTQE
jgi:hypothetical protein